MGSDLPGALAREQGGGWVEEEGTLAGWEAPGVEQGLAEDASAPVVGLRFFTRQGLPAII